MSMRGCGQVFKAKFLGISINIILKHIWKEIEYKGK